MGRDWVIELVNVSKVYPLPAGDVVALDNISLSIGEGEFVAFMGYLAMLTWPTIERS